MRKSILVKFIQVILAALALSSAIFYIATSSSLLRNSREDMMYTLQMLDSVLDYSGDFQAQLQKLESTITSHGGRFTIIDSQGTVVCDTGVDTATMDNHLDRQEVRDALSEGSGYSTRYSNTLETVSYTHRATPRYLLMCQRIMNTRLTYGLQPSRAG